MKALLQETQAQIRSSLFSEHFRKARGRKVSQFILAAARAFAEEGWQGTRKVQISPREGQFLYEYISMIDPDLTPFHPLGPRLQLYGVQIEISENA